MNTRSVEELLPFYANGSLSSEEKTSVEHGLKHNPELAEELEFLTRLRTQMQETPQEKSPGELGWKRLEKMIRVEKQKSDWFSQLAARVSDQDNKAWRAVALAACLLLMVQTVHVWQSPQQDLTAASSSVEGAAITIMFAPNASEKDIRELLVTLDLQIVEGPSALGVYQLSAEGDIEQKLEVLRARKDIVESAQKARP